MARTWHPNHTDPPALDGPQQPPGNRRRVWPWVLLVAIVVVVLLVIAVACATALGGVVAPSVDRA